jgi:hypothetical protein
MMFALCLIAALAGTPLRQAEAAKDFARSVADLDEGPDIDEIDGGVGDDSDAGIVKGGSDTHSDQAISLLSLTHSGGPTLHIISSFRPDHHAIHFADRLPADSVRKHVWLGCFLF